MALSLPWVYLILAGVLEIGWAMGLKYTDGFTKPLPSVLTIGTMVASLYLLSLAARDLPIGTAYAIWVGIGVVGAFILGVVILGEPVTVKRIAFFILLVVALAGIKMTST